MFWQRSALCGLHAIVGGEGRGCDQCQSHLVCHIFDSRTVASTWLIALPTCTPLLCYVDGRWQAMHVCVSDVHPSCKSDGVSFLSWHCVLCGSIDGGGAAGCVQCAFVQVPVSVHTQVGLEQTTLLTCPPPPRVFRCLWWWTSDACTCHACIICLESTIDDVPLWCCCGYGSLPG